MQAKSAQRHILRKKKRKDFFITRKNRIFATALNSASNKDLLIIKILIYRKKRITDYHLTNIKMTKANIIDEIVNQTGIARKDVSATVEAFMDAIKSSLIDRKENVYLRGFGSFIVKHRAEKTARNISKNTTIVIPAHDFPDFKPAKSFVARMKGEDFEVEG